MSKTAYQPTWRDGAVRAKGERDCADRYEAIRDVLAGIDGPFSVLDIGAHLGYFPVRIAEDYPASRITALDSLPELTSIACEQITVDNRRADPAELAAMARHDVVLALSVLHHFADWAPALDQIRACRSWAIVEVPHPDEKWMRWAAARGQLRALHDAVAELAVRKLGDFERVGRDGSRHLRPMYLIPGSVRSYTATVFAGSGTCSRKLTPALHGRGLPAELGYQPYPGSLNLRAAGPVDFGPPAVDWPGRLTPGGRRRPYQFWPAWAGAHTCHAMIPGPRGHGPDCFELVAADRLRDTLGLADGEALTVDVAHGR